MIILFKAKQGDLIFKVERIDFFKDSFLVFYEEKMGLIKSIKNNEIEYLATKSGYIIYPNKNYLSHFSDAIINAIMAAGGSKEFAEKYFIENYT